MGDSGKKAGRAINNNQRNEGEALIGPHGGYRNLLSFQVARLIYDVTVRFCELYIERFSRTRDQMVQAARSGVQNIAEGSQASGTSRKAELKLTNVARASLEELRLDYEDYLRQRGETPWPAEHPALKRFKARRCRSMEDVRAWLESEKHTDKHGLTQTGTGKRQNAKPIKISVDVGEGPCKSVNEAVPAANAALSLLNLAGYLLDRQIAAQAAAFEREGGFTERMYRVRAQRR
ncbi:MAG: four helix bundle protein [Sedimentisphaerales bacterium]|nr:four helix bundle protein [Sedimentisphaerales bacterium]